MDLSPSTLIRILTDVTGVLDSTKQLHDILVAHQAEATALVPVIQNIGEAPAAIDAAEKAAPNLTEAIRHLVFVSAPVPEPRTIVNKKAENLVRSIGGLGPMSADQEAAWMARFTPTGNG